MPVSSCFRRLHMPEDYSVKDFQKLFPDMKGQVKKLSYGFTLMKNVFELLGYDGPPELFCMYTCFFPRRGSEGHRPAYVEGSPIGIKAGPQAVFCKVEAKSGSSRLGARELLRVSSRDAIVVAAWCLWRLGVRQQRQQQQQQQQRQQQQQLQQQQQQQ